MARTSFNDVVNSFARWRLDLFQRGLSFVWAISCSSARSGKGFLDNGATGLLLSSFYTIQTNR